MSILSEAQYHRRTEAVSLPMKSTFLPRWQLVELMDFAWFPGWLRRYQTDVLLFYWRQFAPKREIAGQLASLVGRCSSKTIVDLCSGSGGLVTAIFEDVRNLHGGDLALVLTDVFPNRKARLADGISYWPEPVDARSIDARLLGARTMFSSLHHFAPDQAREILRDASRSGQPIAIYELTKRSIWCLVLIALNALLGPLLFTPLLRPFSCRRIVFTYVLPLVPATLLFDGIVSVFRTYTERELQEMVAEEADLSYEWQSGVHRSLLMSVLYFRGSPKVRGEVS